MGAPRSCQAVVSLLGVAGLLLAAPHPSAEPRAAPRTWDKAMSPTRRHTGHRVRGTQTAIPCRDSLQPFLLAQAGCWLFSPIPGGGCHRAARLRHWLGTLLPALGAVTRPHAPAVPIPVSLSPVGALPALGLGGGCSPRLPAQQGAVSRAWPYPRAPLCPQGASGCCWFTPRSGTRGSAQPYLQLGKALLPGCRAWPLSCPACRRSGAASGAALTCTQLGLGKKV